MDKRDDMRFSRRRVMGTLAMAVGGLATLPLLSHLLRRPARPDPRFMDLPGEGSIFQPRNDERLQEWLRRHGSASES